MQLKTQVQHVQIEEGMLVLIYVAKIKKFVDDLKMVDHVADDDERVRLRLGNITKEL